jgi:hypothetical protein
MSTIPEVLPPAGSPQLGAEVGIQPLAGTETGELALWEIQPGDPLYEAAQRVAESTSKHPSPLPPVERTLPTGGISLAGARIWAEPFSLQPLRLWPCT